MIKNLQELLSEKPFRETRRKALSIIENGLLAADSGRAVERVIGFDGNSLVAGGERIELAEKGRVYVVGAGKASAAMAKALNRILGERIEEGIIVSTSKCKAGRIGIVEGSHPLPNKTNTDATERILELVEKADKNDLVIVLISGGGSALLCKPAKGLSLEDLKNTNRLLLSSNATINEINCVRKHLSGVKGGRLAAKAFPAMVVALIVSDVVGDDISTIASGPTACDNSTYKDAVKVLKKHGVFERVPESVRNCLREGMLGKREETLKPGSRVLKRVKNVLVLGRVHVLKAMGKRAKELGLKTVFFGRAVEGNARDAGKKLVKKAFKERNNARKGIAFLAAGETTLEVKGKGTGGRNQEMLLASLKELEKCKQAVFVAVDSDGIDGNSPAAGAIADSNSLARARELELKPEKFFERNDSFHFFKKLRDVIVTGKTGSSIAGIYAIVLP